MTNLLLRCCLLTLLALFCVPATADDSLSLKLKTANFSTAATRLNQ